MPSYNSSSPVSSVSETGTLLIDALTENSKWGGGAGSGTTLSYSFPWISGASANWYADFSEFGPGTYSSRNEPSARLHYGLDTTQMAAARSAIQAWANVANITPQEIRETGSTVGDVRFAWTSASNGGAWGWAYSPADGYAPSGDIWLSTSGVTSTDWSAGAYNFEALMHEVGHALGLKHPGNYGGTEEGPYLSLSLDSRQYTIMSYTDQAHDEFRKVTLLSGGASRWDYVTVAHETPMPFDIAAIQYLYGANTSYHSGNDTYTFSTTAPFFRTIWDAGGTDAISISNFTLGSTINLTPGSYSSIRIPSDPLPAGGSDSVSQSRVYDGTDNLAIAYGVTIENATGGSGNDTLIGNTANNILDGGAGGDTMQGGKGDDTYVVDSTSDKVVEAVAEGTDLVQASTNFTLPDNVEKLTLTGSALSAVGNQLANVITGNSQNNTLTGGAGDDVLNGGEGTDTAVFSGSQSSYTLGRSGATVVVSGPDGRDLLDSIENLVFASGTPVSVASLSLATVSLDTVSVTRGGVTTSEAATPFSGTPIAGVTINYQFIGASTGEVVVGTGSNDFINLGGGDDAGAGSAGADILDGGTGSNFLSGGSGIDTFFLDGRSGGVVWSTITDWAAGEQLSVWGWKSTSKVIVWREDGADGFKGITMHADLNNDGTIDTSVTWSGQTQSSIPTPGEFPGQDLLWFT